MANEAIKIHLTAENVETKLYINAVGKYCVRIRDLDAEENVGCVICPTLELAEKYFEKWTK